MLVIKKAVLNVIILFIFIAVCFILSEVMPSHTSDQQHNFEFYGFKDYGDLVEPIQHKTYNPAKFWGIPDIKEVSHV